MEICNIFPETHEFINSLHQLNEEEEKVCVDLFHNLATRMMEGARASPTSPKVAIMESSSTPAKHQDILNSILERVAFFPVKPAVMEAELTRLGLSPGLSSSLSTVWSSVAKAVVMARRRVASSLQGTHCQVLRAVPGGEEAVLIHLQQEDEVRGVKLRFQPDQLFRFYEQLEQIQTSLDKICQ